MLEGVDEQLKRLVSAVSSIEQEFGLKDGFLLDLGKGDDWSFVIKMHALIEAMVSHLLTHAIGDTRLSEFFERLELSNPRTGKIAVAEMLELLENPERRFIRLVSELRNRLVHNIRNVNFDLQTYYEGLDKNQRQRFLDGASWWYSPGPSDLADSTKSNPQSILWFALLSLIVRINDRLSVAKDCNQKLQEILEFPSGDGAGEIPPNPAA
jgi:uncharacterized protein YutE (UPF0331/DUF86 family)